MEWSAEKISKGEAMLLRLSKEDNQGCRLWISSKTGNYGNVKFQKRSMLAHRLSYQLHMLIPKLDPDIFVRHLCGNSLCIEPSHLTQGTALENEHDKIAHGTSAHGKNAKISIETIKNSKGEGRQEDRAKRFGVTKAIVDNVDQRNTWAWLGKVPEEDDKRIHSTKTDHNRKRKRKSGDDLSQDDLKRARKYILERTTNPASETLCMIWKNRKDKAGYGMASFSSRNFMAHRLSYCAFHNIGTIPEGMLVRHQCTGDRACVNPFHLELGTAKENAADRIRDGTHLRGETNARATITKETAIAIMQSKGEGTMKERAVRFGTTSGAVSSIDCGVNWKWLRGL